MNFPDNTYFSSDMHFRHKNIIKYSNRPYASIEEMQEGLIANHNSRVRPQDWWFHLGDFAFAPYEYIASIVKRLNGKKVMLPGNHDNWEHLLKLKEAGLVDHVFRDWFGKIGNHRFHLYHFPIQSWEGAHHGTIHLHGHSHGSTTSPDMLRLDVGVDCHNWFPISYKEIAEWADTTLEKLKKKDVPLDPGRNRMHG